MRMRARESEKEREPEPGLRMNNSSERVYHDQEQRKEFKLVLISFSFESSAGFGSLQVKRVCVNWKRNAAYVYTFFSFTGLSQSSWVGESGSLSRNNWTQREISCATLYLWVVWNRWVVHDLAHLKEKTSKGTSSVTEWHTTTLLIAQLYVPLDWPR